MLITDKPDGLYSYPDSTINSKTVQEKLVVNQIDLLEDLWIFLKKEMNVYNTNVKS